MWISNWLALEAAMTSLSPERTWTCRKGDQRRSDVEDRAWEMLDTVKTNSHHRGHSGLPQAACSQGHFRDRDNAGQCQEMPCLLCPRRTNGAKSPTRFWCPGLLGGSASLPFALGVEAGSTHWLCDPACSPTATCPLPRVSKSLKEHTDYLLQNTKILELACWLWD